MNDCRILVTHTKLHPMDILWDTVNTLLFAGGGPGCVGGSVSITSVSVTSGATFIIMSHISSSINAKLRTGLLKLTNQ